MGTIHLRRGDTVYVYSSHSYWDKEAKQHKTDRKLIGKLDPVTGEVVPTRKYVRKQASASDAPAEQANSVRAEGSTKTLISRITELEETNASLRNENTQLSYQDAVQKASASLASVNKEAR